MNTPSIMVTGNASAALRRDLRLITLAWGFGSAWLWIAAGAAMTRFAVEVGTPDWAFGVLAAVPFLAALTQLPVSWWLNARGGRRVLFLWCCTMGRAMFVLIGLLPWVVPEAWGWWPAVVVMLLLAHGLMQSTGPAWLNWMSDLIPRRVRGRYFARRSQLVTPVAVAASLGSAWLLDWAEAQNAAGLMLQVTSALMVVAGVLGAIDILIFLGIKDPHAGPPPHPRAGPGLRTLFTPLRDRGFRHFLGFNFGFTLATGFIGQYLWLYVLKDLGWTNLLANALVLAVPMVLQMLTRPAWGRLCDRLGKKPVLLTSAAVMSFGSLGWMLMSPSLWWPGYLAVMLMTLVWPGVELANFNYLLEFSKDSSRSRRGERGGGSQSAALFSVATAVAGGLSGAIGAVVAGSLGDWEWRTGLGDYTFKYFHLLFLISTVLRLGAMLFLFGLEEPTATGTRDAMRYMASGLYNNVRSAAMTPVRLAGPVRRWGYRIDPKRGGHGGRGPR